MWHELFFLTIVRLALSRNVLSVQVSHSVANFG